MPSKKLYTDLYIVRISMVSGRSYYVDRWFGLTQQKIDQRNYLTIDEVRSVVKRVNRNPTTYKSGPDNILVEKSLNKALHLHLMNDNIKIVEA